MLPTDIPGLADQLERASIAAARRLMRRHAQQIRRGGDPRWAPLAESTQRRRRKQQPGRPVSPLFERGSLAAAVERMEFRQYVDSSSSDAAVLTTIGPDPFDDLFTGRQSFVMTDQLFGTEDVGAGYETDIPARPLLPSEEFAADAAGEVQTVLEREYGIRPDVSWNILWD